MKVLSLDTSTMIGGTALIDSEKGILGEVRINLIINKPRTYTENLMPSIDLLLKTAECRIKDIDVFSVIIGPGSFTGLRIGLSTIKGFVFANKKSVIGISSLEALAWNFPYTRYPVCTILDARKNEIYSAIFEWHNEGFIKSLDIGIYTLSDILKDIKSKTIFTGEGSILYRNEIINSIGENAVFAALDKIYISPSIVSMLGLKKSEKSLFSDPANLKPVYLRSSMFKKLK